ncbi:hypothetical protein PJI17_03410 [Mycobacterium kansasii]
MTSGTAHQPSPHQSWRRGYGTCAPVERFTAGTDPAGLVAAAWRRLGGE